MALPVMVLRAVPVVVEAAVVAPALIGLRRRGVSRLLK
jgi:hypothetical protein